MPGGSPTLPTGAGLSLSPTKINNEGLPVDPKEGEPTSNIPPETLEDMKNLWDVFDMEKTNHVPIKELQKMMRALDFDLNDQELDYVRKQIDPEEEGFIRFERLQGVMEEKLKDIDTYEDLLDQFKHLDKDESGKIPNPLFKQYMMTMGKKMTLEEFDDMMKEADPKGEGMVDIEEFALRLCPPKK